MPSRSCQGPARRTPAKRPTAIGYMLIESNRIESNSCDHPSGAAAAAMQTAVIERDKIIWLVRFLLYYCSSTVVATVTLVSVSIFGSGGVGVGVEVGVGVAVVVVPDNSWTSFRHACSRKKMLSS